MSDSLPRQFGRYTLTERLGAGGMGEVVVARDSLLQRQVAIKIPKSDMAHLDETPERLLREARALAALHPHHLCPIFDCGWNGEQYFLVMPLLGGSNLAQHLKRNGRMEIVLAVRVAARIADAVAAAHDLGIAHRDLKPGNIMLNDSLMPIVLDFGLGHSTSAETIPSHCARPFDRRSSRT